MITLTAVAKWLYDRFEINKVLVVAPLRVAEDTWTKEVISGIIFVAFVWSGSWAVKRSEYLPSGLRQIFTASTEKTSPGW